jgi:glycosyltransferase involved in cell wall biosynthesis
MKTLAICIPTYRRPTLLERCVRSALTSALGRPISIVVADDAMSDDNVLTMTRLTAEHPNVYWHRNTSNLGIDDNIQNVVDLCRSDFAWLIGEDDTFTAGAVAAMFDRLQHLDAPFVFANYRYTDQSMQRELGTALPLSVSISMPCRLFIEQHLWAVGFIGACMVRKTSWDATAPAPYHGTYYTHVGRIAEMLASQTAVTLVSEPCVCNRVEGDDVFTWKKDSYGVFFGFVAMCRRVGERIPALAESMVRAAAAMERRHRWLSLRVALRLRSENAFDRAQYDKYLRHWPMSGLKKQLLLWVSVAPPAFFRPLVALYRSVRR